MEYNKNDNDNNNSNKGNVKIDVAFVSMFQKRLTIEIKK